MEWHGINLNGDRQRQWPRRLANKIQRLILCGLLAGGLALLGFYLSEQPRQAMQQLTQQIQPLQSQLRQLRTQIAQQQHQPSPHAFSPPLTSLQVADFIRYLQQFALAGSISTARLWLEGHRPQLRITGQLATQQQVEQLIQPLNELTWHYQLEQLEMNPQQQLDFSLLISLPTHATEKDNVCVGSACN